MTNSSHPYHLHWAVLFVLGAGTAAADSTEIIERCRAAGSPERHIACLEQFILNQAEPADLPAEAVTHATATSGPADDVAVSPPEPHQPPADSAEQDDSVTPAVAVEQAATQPALANAARPPAAAAEAEAAGQSGIEGFGEEQLESVESQNAASGKRYSINVVAFDFVRRDKLRVRLENGQVWQQRDSDRPNLYPALRNVDGFTVELWRNSRGGYRMSVPRANRVIRVERVK